MKLSVDLGGTNIRAARVDKGTCSEYMSVACPSLEDEDAIISKISNLISSLIDEQVDGIGIGVPSIVDTQAGIVYNTTNISSWKEVHLKERLENRFHVPVLVDNDCNCFALGESMYGTGRTYQDMVGITLGTGVGMGVIINRQLYGGLYHGAGELGSLPYLDADYERYCSSHFFTLKGGTGADFARRAEAGEQEATDILNEFGMHIGQLIKAVLFTYAPQLIVLGGGISAAFPLFKGGMKQALQNFPYKIISDKTDIQKSTLKEANLLGAAALFS